LQQARSCATAILSGVFAQRRAGKQLERTLIQAFAEDAPRSHGAPGRLGRADGRSINARGPIREQESQSHAKPSVR
jgi:hypothetical protein